MWDITMYLYAYLHIIYIIYTCSDLRGSAGDEPAFDHAFAHVFARGASLGKSGLDVP